MFKWIGSAIVMAGTALAAVGKPMDTGVWEGFVNFGSKETVANFRKCNSKEIWWLRGKQYSDTAEEMRKRHAELTSSPYDQVYARLRGEVSKNKGQFGPLGTYHRVFYVTEIIEMREKRPTDCAAE